MKRMRPLRLWISVLSLCALLDVSQAGSAANDAAVVTYLEGKVHVYTVGQKKKVLIRLNDRIARNQELRVGDRSRIELRFPGGTVMRFAEHSVVRMDRLSFNPETMSTSVKVSLGIGGVWASVRKLLNTDSKVEVQTVNAVAGVRGTVYRVNVEPDDSALIKVYDGIVYVDGVQSSTPPLAESEESKVPAPVPGPHVVPPPYHEVTMEEWHMILKSFQQITISPQGVASKPEEFSVRNDMDEWVKWNMERDNLLKI